MQLTTCCGCFSLKAGTISIGVCGIVLTVISLIVIFTSDVAWKWASKDFGAKNIDKTTINIIFAVSHCIAILISALLIIGALMKNTCMMLPWVIWDIIGLVAVSAEVCVSAILFFINRLVLTGVLWLFFGLIIITYLWLVVYYYLKQIKIEKMNNRMGKEPNNFQQV